MSQKVIFLNGPPRSGKDTLAEFMIDIGNKPMVWDTWTLAKMAWPLKRGAPAIFGLSDEEWQYLEANHKEEPREELLGLTPRELQISLSEDWAKDKFGIDVFGRILLQWMKRQPTELGSLTHFVISDSGFYHEAVPIINHYGNKNCKLFHIFRDGCSFDNDSRDYIDLSEHGVEMFQIDNNGTLEDLKQVGAGIHDYVQGHINGRELNLPVSNLAALS